MGTLALRAFWQTHEAKPCQTCKIKDVFRASAICMQQAPLRKQGRILKPRGKRTKRRAEGGRRQEEKNKLRRKLEGDREGPRSPPQEFRAEAQPQLPRGRQTQFEDAWGPVRERPVRPVRANRRAMPSQPAHRFLGQPPARTWPPWLPLQKGTPASRGQGLAEFAGM